jgi:hypothetical protein
MKSSGAFAPYAPLQKLLSKNRGEKQKCGIIDIGGKI